MEHKLRLSSK